MRILAGRQTACAQGQRPALHAAEPSARRQSDQTIFHAPHPLQARKETGVVNSKIDTLDVRPDLRSGQHPFHKIQDALSRVGEGDALRLLAPFEPVPLYHVATSQGFVHQSSQTPEGDWEVIFTRNAAPAATIKPTPPEHSACGCDGPSSAKIIEVNARHLEPPQPMIRILEALARLPEGASLRAHTDRRPIHLYSHLEDRGYAGKSEEQSDGSFITHICRA
jgi:uncharacterized protein (DUF2249 family)